MKNPFGLHTVTPYLVVDGVEGVIAFAGEVFEAEPRGDLKYRDDGSVMHAEITIGDSVIMLGEPMGDADRVPGMLYVYVDDCDASYSRALEAGATAVLAPADYPHGDRYGGVRDTGGTIWWIVTHLGSRSP